MVRRLCLIAVLLVISGAASAENHFRPQGSAEEKACGRDAHRFCKEAIPDQFQVASCLQMNREKISQACRTALEGHGM